MFLRACQRDAGMHACFAVLDLFLSFLYPSSSPLFSVVSSITNPTPTFIFYRSPS
jgi:hypothetical protein